MPATIRVNLTAQQLRYWVPSGLRLSAAGYVSVRRLLASRELGLMDWNWKEIDLPSFTTILSTGQAQPLAPELLPSWAQSSTEFSGAWL